MVSSVKSRPNHYETLGLKPTASGDDIAAAFAIESCKIIQSPRVNEPSVRAQARQIREAHETLRDQAKRRAYDASLGLEVEPHTSRPETPAERSATPFSEAPERKPLEQGAREKSGVRETQLQPKRSSRTPAHRGGRPLREAPPSVKHDPIPQQKQERPQAPAGPHVVPFIARPTREPAHSGAYDTSPGLPPQSESEPLLERRRSDPPISQENESHGTMAGGPLLDSEKPRSKVNRIAVGVGALIVAFALFAASMWPLGGRVERTSSAHRASAAGQALGSNPVNNGPPQQSSEESILPMSEGVDPSSNGTLVPRDIGPSMPRVVSLAGSAPLDVSVAREAVKLPQLQEEVHDPAAADGPRPAAITQALPRAETRAEVAEATRAEPAPVTDRQTQAKWVGGTLANRDNPRGRFQGTVSVRFTVPANGKATGCRPTVSSGNAALDARTCELVEQNLQFSPAVSSQGLPIASEMLATYTWGARRRTITGRLLDLVRTRRR